LVDLGTLGGTHSFGTAINLAGQVVGYGDTAGDLALHAFVYKGGSMIDLGTLGGTKSYAHAINSAERELPGNRAENLS